MEKMALKRLTASDLTFFKWHFENRNAGNQKALNLSRNVFIDELYPTLGEILRERSDIKLPVTLYLYGPGVNSTPYVLQRKILKTASYKNWRLNGEFIYPPEEEPERFNMLKPDDFALIGFEGLSCPTALHIDFIASENENDTGLFKELDTFMGTIRGNMKQITFEQLNQIVKLARPKLDHPVFRYILDEDLIEAVQGDPIARDRVFRHSCRSMSQDELKRAQQKADDIGKMGEDLVACHLQRQLDAGEIAGYEWTARENAIAPYDFRIINNDGTIALVDVKSTLGSFTKPLHISMAEILTMPSSKHSYYLYRVYDLEKKGGRLRVSDEMGAYASKVIDSLRNLPSCTNVDSISVMPEFLQFGSCQFLLFADEGE